MLYFTGEQTSLKRVLATCFQLVIVLAVSEMELSHSNKPYYAVSDYPDSHSTEFLFVCLFLILVIFLCAGESKGSNFKSVENPQDISSSS